jgi:nicotinamide phosphoribosyltransferase
MGGGLLQKLNRDTQRFAFKASAIKRAGVWIPVQKKPLDSTKASKAGRLSLVKDARGYMTVAEGTADELVTVFENGELLVDQTFEEIRARAAL